MKIEIKTKKKFDAVKFMRQQRDRVTQIIKGMSWIEWRLLPEFVHFTSRRPVSHSSPLQFFPSIRTEIWRDLTV